MNIETIHAKIDELLTLVEGWSEQEGATNIERDLALQKLTQLYDIIRFDATTSHEHVANEQQTEVETIETEEPIEEEFTSSSDIFDDSIFEINIDSVSLIDDEVEEQSHEEAEQEIEVEAETKEEEAEEEAIEEVAIEPTERPKSQDNVLFDIDIVPKQSRSRRSALMSLYQNEEVPAKRNSRGQVKERTEAATSQAEPTLDVIDTKPAQAEPAQEIETKAAVEPQSIDQKPKPTVAEVIAPNVKTLAEQLAERHRPRPLNDRVHYRSFNDLGINERYLLSRELFGDDPQRCRQVLTALEACREYEDAMIYIAENFNWSEKSPGANVINTILENKFNI